MLNFAKRWALTRVRREIAKRTVKSSIALGLTLSAAALVSPAHAAGPIVTTTQGKVLGFLKNGVTEFLGIPYAAPPVGNLRWRPPVKHAPWTNVIHATVYAPNCAEVETLGVFAGPANNNEDCLYINIFTPNLSGDVKEKLPVMVWDYGGGDVDGESNDYD